MAQASVWLARLLAIDAAVTADLQRCCPEVVTVIGGEHRSANRISGWQSFLTANSWLNLHLQSLGLLVCYSPLDALASVADRPEAKPCGFL